MTVPAKTPSGEIMESVLIQGDLAKLTPQQRADYYLRVCESLGLNPLTRPFEYINLNGKLRLYALRDCADQLRKKNGISIKLLSQEFVDDLLIVHAGATDKTERADEDLGAVACPPTLKGEARANAILKCVTKAKRRVTLSISGLGFLDETEVDDIPVSARRPSARPNVMLDAPEDAAPGRPRPPAADPSEAAPAEMPPQETAGAVDDAEDRSVRIARLDRELAAAAEQGWHPLKDVWDSIPDEDAKILNAAMNKRHKPRAADVERARKEQ